MVRSASECERVSNHADDSARQRVRSSAWFETAASRPPHHEDFLLLQSIPPQPLEDRAAHHPILVLLGEEIQLLGEMGDALAIGGLGERMSEVGAPVAAARPE